MGLIFYFFLAAMCQVSFQVEIKVMLESPVPFEPYDIVSVCHETLDPGDEGYKAHYHPGLTLGQVIAGEYLLQVDDKPLVIMTAGQTMWMHPKAAHVWGANASNTTMCQLTFTIFSRVGQPLMYLADIDRGSYEDALSKATRPGNLNYEYVA